MLLFACQGDLIVSGGILPKKTGKMKTGENDAAVQRRRYYIMKRKGDHFCGGRLSGTFSLSHTMRTKSSMYLGRYSPLR